MNSEPVVEKVDPHAILRKYDPQSRLGLYFRWLTKENDRINLVSRETIADGLERLAFESLVPLEKIDRSHIRNYLDIGSGGGIPAIPLLLAATSKGQCCHATLVERVQKKCGALRRISFHLDLDRTNSRLDLLCETFEQCLFHREFDLITLRYVTLTAPMLEKIIPILRPDGSFVYYSTPQFETARAEIDAVTYHYRSGWSPQRNSFTVITKK